ncbi:hypothetical protein ACET3Z_015791 [Daucus carota]
MVPYIDNLFHKRGSVREKGLTTLITKLKSGIQLELVEENYFTILSRCENSIKKGSGLEIKLAAQVIGLIALTAGPGDCANEIYSESLRVLPQALETKSQPIPILECLAIVTFVRDGDFDETERSMKIIWEYINKQFLKEGVARVVVVAIYAWSFLLAKADHCKLDRNYWKGVIPFFLELLKNEDEYALYHPLIIEALALVSDKGIKHKFCSETDEALVTQVLEDAGMMNVQTAVEATTKVSEVSEDLKCHQTSLNVCGNIFTLRTWSEQKKMNYVKRYLGDGFKKHIVDNNFLRNAFKCSREEYAGPTLYVPEEKEVITEIYVPGGRDIKDDERLMGRSSNSSIHGETRQKNFLQSLIGKSGNSIMSKGRTQHRNKLRMISQACSFYLLTRNLHPF